MITIISRIWKTEKKKEEICTRRVKILNNKFLLSFNILMNHLVKYLLKCENF